MTRLALNAQRPTILVTGISGNLGRRLIPLLSDYEIVGVDLAPVTGHPEIAIHPLDLATESSCIQLVKLLRECGAATVVHLAFMMNSAPEDLSDHGRMWQTNVAGTARVMEAIAEVNRHGGTVHKFICPSSAAVYGADTAPFVDEDAPMASHTVRYALQKSEADEVVRFRASAIGRCTTYLLRPHILTGADVENCVVSAIRGRAYGNGSLGNRYRQKQKKLPLLLPMGESYLQKHLQFVHVDDMARLVHWLLQKGPAREGEALVLNVAGSGAPLSISRCAEVAQMRIKRLPTSWLCSKVMRLMWKWGISTVPAEALPYITGSCTTSTERLRELLGQDYGKVIRYSTEEALKDCVAENTGSSAASA
jgi:nucleoside-diphosphate-sugar epimerase